MSFLGTVGCLTSLAYHATTVLLPTVVTRAQRASYRRGGALPPNPEEEEALLMGDVGMGEWYSCRLRQLHTLMIVAANAWTLIALTRTTTAGTTAPTHPTTTNTRNNKNGADTQSPHASHTHAQGQGQGHGSGSQPAHPQTVGAKRYMEVFSPVKLRRCTRMTLTTLMPLCILPLWYQQRVTRHLAKLKVRSPRGGAHGRARSRSASNPSPFAACVHALVFGGRVLCEAALALCVVTPYTLVLGTLVGRAGVKTWRVCVCVCVAYALLTYHAQGVWVFAGVRSQRAVALCVSV